MTVDERVAVLGDDAALLKAECPELDANPEDGRAGGLSDLDDADSVDTRPVTRISFKSRQRRSVTQFLSSLRTE
jgi:hypothetical protein